MSPHNPTHAIRWRDAIIGALASLAVTIIAGIVVFYVSRHATKRDQAERVVFTVDPIARFAAESASVGFTAVRVENLGAAPATDVVIVIEAPSGIILRNFRTQSSAGPATNIVVRDTSAQKLRAALGSLAPGEVVTINLLLGGTSPDSGLRVGVRSASSIANRGPVVPDAEVSVKGRLVRIVPGFVIGALAIQLALLFVLRLFGRLRSFNDTAFVYLHAGLPNEARELLEEGMRRGGGDPFMIANYALCHATAGDHERAARLLDAADFYSTSVHERAIVAFNRSLALFLGEKEDPAIAEFDRALSLSRRSIRRYARFSRIVQELKLRSATVATSFATRGI